MSNRPELELVLDRRSYETVVVLASSDQTTKYPDGWWRAERGDLSEINDERIVVVDRVDITRKTLIGIGSRRPRILAMAPQNVEQEKSMRRLLTSTYPWAEVWTLYTSFGKLLVTNGAQGDAYDRDAVVDMRPPLGAA